MKRTGLILAAALLFGWLLADAASAQTSGPWRFIAEHNGKCIDINGASMGSGVKTQVYGCHTGANQKFNLESTSGGHFKIIAEHSGKCLEVKDSSDRPGKDIEQATCDGGTNQEWIKNIGLGNFGFRNRHSGLCINADTRGWPYITDKLEQRNCGTSNSQLFTERPANCGDGICQSLSEEESIFNCPEDCSWGGGGSGGAGGGGGGDDDPTLPGFEPVI